MLLKPTPIQPVPEETARVARAAFPKGNPYLILRDQLGVIFHDSDFADLYPATGQHSLTPSKKTLTSWWSGRCLLAIAFLAAVVEVVAAECPPERKPSCARNEKTVCVRDHRGETTRYYWECRAVSSTPPPDDLPDLIIFPVEQCILCPGCSLPSRRDSLQFTFRIRNQGPAPVNRLVHVRGVSNFGLIGETNTALGSGPASTVLGIEVSGQDYNREHQFEIVADPKNQIPELDKSNNKTSVRVTLPAKIPSQPLTLQCTSPVR